MMTQIRIDSTLSPYSWVDVIWVAIKICWQNRTCIGIIEYQPGFVNEEKPWI